MPNSAYRQYPYGRTAAPCLARVPYLGEAGGLAVDVLLKALYLGLGAVADLRALVVGGDGHIQARHQQAVAAAVPASLLNLHATRPL